MRAAVLLAVIVAGCGGRSHACDELGGVVDRWLAAELASASAKATPTDRAAADEIARQLHPALRDALLQSCRDTKWASDTIACVAAAADDAAARACPLTRDQADALGAVLMNTTAKVLEGSGGPAPGAAPLAP